MGFNFSSRLMGYFLAVVAIVYVPSLSVSFALLDSLTSKDGFGGFFFPF